MGSKYLKTVEGSATTPSESPDSLNGLKFGQKIYFEDVDLEVSGKYPAKKGGRRVAQSGQPPKCQVEGCNVDLSEAKAYYSRHKVCGMHSKSSAVVVGGLQQRFCQQCSRFHQLNEFDQGKRSCRRRLAGHNERRRKPPLPASLLSSHLGRFSSSLFAGDSGTRNGGFLLDFSSYQRHSSKDPWAGHCEEPFPEMYLQGFSIPTGECITADSNRALSLLSNQTRGSRNRPEPSSSIGGFTDLHGASSMANSVTVAHLSSDEANGGLRVVPPPPDYAGLTQIYRNHHYQFGGDQYLMDQFHNRAYNS